MERRGLSDAAFVIPAFNERTTIGWFVESLRPHGDVIVVDDASTDGTAEAAERGGAHVVRLDRNRGYGQAIDAGFRVALDRGCRFAVTADGDGQHDPAEVVEFARVLREQPIDLVIGIRPGRRRIVERLCAMYARRVFGVRDPLCGLKGYDLRYFVEYGAFDRHDSVGTELMTYALRRGARWTQLPITIHGRADGGSRFYASVGANLRILRSLRALVAVR